jgi:hypothetical protein
MVMGGYGKMLPYPEEFLGSEQLAQSLKPGGPLGIYLGRSGQGKNVSEHGLKLGETAPALGSSDETVEKISRYHRYALVLSLDVSVEHVPPDCILARKILKPCFAVRHHHNDLPP